MTLSQIDTAKLTDPVLLAVCRRDPFRRLALDAVVTESRQLQEVLDGRADMLEKYRRRQHICGFVVSVEMIAAWDEVVAEKAARVAHLAGQLEAATGTAGLRVPLVLPPIPSRFDPQAN